MHVIFFLTLLLPFSMAAKTYYTEYVEGDSIIIFHGNVEEEDESRIRVLERKYMDQDQLPGDESYRKWKYEKELEELGISIEVIPNTDSERSLPFDSPSGHPEENIVPPSTPHPPFDAPYDHHLPPPHVVPFPY